MSYKSDIEIAQSTPMEPIENIAAEIGISKDDIEFYGKNKAKVDYDLLKKHASGKDGHLILVTAITPTPAGEGKTTTTVGLGDSLRRIGKKTI
ncbi:MAG TPA: formate--tetrahydrofolate ligase, partial [Clostridiales bacterium]|nr:formate--tetrahydrofolate ligase [Clostridiales bacterium]